MLTSLLVAWAAFAAPAELPPVGTALVYEGRMAGVKDDGDPQIKEFELQLVLAAAEDGAATWLWALAETGRGGFSWTDRWGRWTTRAGRPDEGPGPALLYRRHEGDGVAPLIAPVLLTADALTEGAAWTDGRLEYRVAGAVRRDNRDCWEVEVRSPVGLKRTIVCDRAQQIIVQVRETVFLGQGVQHDLTFRLKSQTALSPEQLRRSFAAAEQWTETKAEMQRAPRARQRELSDEQLAVLKGALDALTQASAGTLLEPIALAAAKDLQNQRGRSAAVAAAREQALGKTVPLEQLFDLSGQPFSKESVAGKTVVLHFWTYRDAPLEEPYGQTGYLDFLYRKRSAAGVTVLGVHVDDKLADDETRRGSLASAKRLKNFMNLHYPLAYDRGAVLKSLGDPRVAGGSLPLYVVLDASGKIIEYRAGFYDVKPDRGLSELDTLLDQTPAP